jgi:hypothetical protein
VYGPFVSWWRNDGIIFNGLCVAVGIAAVAFIPDRSIITGVCYGLAGAILIWMVRKAWKTFRPKRPKPEEPKTALDAATEIAEAEVREPPAPGPDSVDVYFNGQLLLGGGEDYTWEPAGVRFEWPLRAGDVIQFLLWAGDSRRRRIIRRFSEPIPEGEVVLFAESADDLEREEGRPLPVSEVPPGFVLVPFGTEVGTWIHHGNYYVAEIRHVIKPEGAQTWAKLAKSPLPRSRYSVIADDEDLV